MGNIMYLEFLSGDTHLTTLCWNLQADRTFLLIFCTELSAVVGL